jgi:23S rRNA (uracil1939-C5)-methyltransferase
VGGLRFSLGPQSFLQVNPSQTALLYDRAIALLAPKKTEILIDAYCGIGTISLMLAKRAMKVIGIEQVAAAIEDARENAKQNGIENAEFHTGAVEDLLPKLLETESVSALVLDPPRKGCGEAALNAIGKSRIQRLVYISCNPATLARDCKLLKSYGFSLDAAEPVDMFPHTSHVECVVRMARMKA